MTRWPDISDLHRAADVLVTHRASSIRFVARFRDLDDGPASRPAVEALLGGER
ncbi:MAG TPA: hypothetical protein VNT51_06990 [Miltoncostaeaceae bacterium]|nr:hypothetical protein [Miltoncostaeaceae bacterium]